jgi:tetratricopeptide (TPR) repeat protein
LESTAADILLDAPPSSARRDWIDVFQEHAIDHLAMSKSIDPPEAFITEMCWLDQRHWIHEYMDGRGGVFGWSPEGKGDPQALDDALRREAFGPVPEDRRVPRTIAAAPEMSALTLYLKGQPPVLSAIVIESRVYREYFGLIQQYWPRAYGPARLVGVWAAPPGLCAAAPGAALMAHTAQTSLFLSPRPVARDPGPVAAALLAVRQARRAVVEHPLDPRAYKSLYLAYRTQAFDVEEYWAPSTAGKTERTELRRVQIATAFRQYLDLEPDDWKARMEFADFLQRDYMLDAALEQVKQALEALEKQRRQARERPVVDHLKAQEKHFKDFNKRIEIEVKRRRTDFEIKSSRKKPLEKFSLAILTPYRTVDERNQEFLDQRGMGLALESLKQLDSINPSELKPEEKTLARFWRFRVLMQLGRLAEAGEELDFIDHPQLADECRLWYAAALGDYGFMDQTIARIEEIRAKASPLAAQRAKLREASVGLISLSGAGELSLLARAHFIYWSGHPMAINLGNLQQMAAVHANSRTLRGLLALESGDTAKAAELFAEALRIAGPDVRFSDRTIAERYLELLRAQK